jgi:hypothetical protein
MAICVDGCSLHSILWSYVNLGRLNWTQKEASCKLQSSSKLHLPSLSFGTTVQSYRPNQLVMQFVDGRPL